METTTRPPEEKVTAQPAEAEAPPRQVIGRFLEPPSVNGTPAPAPEPATPPAVAETPAPAPAPRAPLAVFCHEPPDSYIGDHVRQMVAALARRGSPVHLFARHPFAFTEEWVRLHAVGAADEEDVVDQAHDYSRRACAAFLEQFPAGSELGGVVGYEWSAAPALARVQAERNVQPVLSFHSLERQRSDLTSPVARRIAEIEQAGLRQARTLLLHDAATAEVARHWVPECVDRIVQARGLFPAAEFEGALDPGSVKARFGVGPLDPVLLYVGDINERYGPDIALKAMPAILRHHKQARLVVVGDGSMYWPLRVYARYLLLEHAVRLPGHLQDRPLFDLVQAADIVVVPSREATPWWPILAAWAAGRPVVATHSAAPELLEHERDAILIYPSENSLVWGVERALYDPDLRQTLAEHGRQKLDERFGWSSLAAQVEDLAGAPAR